MAETTYTQCYSNFIGADMTSDPRTVARNRLAYCVNMWRDYESEQGAAIETFPGFRCIRSTSKNNGPINGLWHYKGRQNEYIVFLKGDAIYACDMTGLDYTNRPIEYLADDGVSFDTISFNGVSFFANNNLYILNFLNQNKKPYFVVINEVNKDDKDTINAVRQESYIPTTYYNGKPYEQRNALSEYVKQIDSTGGIPYESDSYNGTWREYRLYEPYTSEKVSDVGIDSVYVGDLEFTRVNYDSDPEDLEDLDSPPYICFLEKCDDKRYLVKSIIIQEDKVFDQTTNQYKTVTIQRKVDQTQFSTIGNLKPFQNDNLTMAQAILGCTKSAVYDGRVFLTGNPELPNTVFYSQRNLTGANDPTYFGVYNYFNDGDGNTPNVDLLAMPSMLMVIKSDTVQDGSVYYHVGVDNTHEDESVRDLMPRLYPSTKGAAGLGSVGTTEAYSLSCNFLDDPVFLSKRGLEAVGKENVSLERTIVHRSSNIDRLLLQEDLAHASIAEWKGYLVICCDGHIYLADSRRLSQHPDGSYQYEWFYLEGVGTYDYYQDAYHYVSSETIVYEDENVKVKIKDVIFNDSDNQSYETFKDHGFGDSNKKAGICNKDLEIMDTTGYYSTTGFNNTTDLSSVQIYYVEEDGVKYPVGTAYGEKIGMDEFHGAKRVLAVGDLLIFATDYDICIFNTDKRGNNILDEDDNIIREVDDDKIDSSYYTFNGVRYRSACATRLDDCDKKSVTKNTLYGTTAARFKMIPGSHCKIRSSINNRDWEDVGEAFSSRFDFSDIRTDNFSFGEDEDNVVVLPEISRGWVNKQYYFYSDGFCEPFGLYELSYIYKIAGKIRYY